MFYESQFGSVAEFLAVLGNLSEQTGEATTWFRGHSNYAYKLVPSIARVEGALARELLLSKRFKQNAYSFRQQPPQDEWEWLFLMQHWDSDPPAGLDRESLGRTLFCGE